MTALEQLLEDIEVWDEWIEKTRDALMRHVAEEEERKLQFERKKAELENQIDWFNRQELLALKELEKISNGMYAVKGKAI
jgi:hypothetical protein